MACSLERSGREAKGIGGGVADAGISGTCEISFVVGLPFDRAGVSSVGLFNPKDKADFFIFSIITAEGAAGGSFRTGSVDGGGDGSLVCTFDSFRGGNRGGNEGTGGGVTS